MHHAPYHPTTQVPHPPRYHPPGTTMLYWLHGVTSVNGSPGWLFFTHPLSNNRHPLPGLRNVSVSSERQEPSLLGCCGENVTSQAPARAEMSATLRSRHRQEPELVRAVGDDCENENKAPALLVRPRRRRHNAVSRARSSFAGPTEALRPTHAARNGPGSQRLPTEAHSVLHTLEVW